MAYISRNTPSSSTVGCFGASPPVANVCCNTGATHVIPMPSGFANMRLKYAVCSKVPRALINSAMLSYGNVA